MNALFSAHLPDRLPLPHLRPPPSKSGYFFKQFGWADLLASLPLPQFKILRVFRLVRVYRLLREVGLRTIGRSADQGSGRQRALHRCC